MPASKQAGDPVFGPRSPGGPVSFARAMAVFRDPVLSPDTSGMTIGSSAAGVPAAMLIYDALTIRDHPLNDADIDAVWRARDYYAPHSLDTRDAGGRMDGWRGCPFFTFYAISPDANGAGTLTDRASYVGGPVLSTNLIMLARPRDLVAPLSSLFMVTGPVAEAHGLVYCSRLEPPLDGFFAIRPPPFDAPTEPLGQLGPKARMLATTPSGLVRVMVSANSRGVRGTIGFQPWPEGFAHGFVQARLPQTAGVMMRPATIVDSRGGWFGLDTSQSEPVTKFVRPLHARTDQWADWSRFGSGTLPAASRGPGPAMSVSPGGFYRLRCGPVPGSLLVSNAEMVVRSTLLAYPGSSSVEWYPERGLMQDGEGVPTGDPSRVPLDTTRISHVITTEDVFISDTQLVLEGEHDVREHDAITVVSGPARGAISVVVQVDVSGGTTTISLSHPFGMRPDTDAELRIGAWRFVSIDHRFDPVPAGDDRTWRGQVLGVPEDDKMGIMVYAISAWRPDVDGFVFGSAGQSGRGYTPQLENAFPGATTAWVEESLADVWIQGLAQQSSQPTAMLDYLDALRGGAGERPEIIWASDAVHAHTTHHAWHNFLRDRASDAGVPAIFAVGHPRVGSYFAQAASGMRTDDAHYSSYGSRIIAEAWLDQLRQLAGGPCAVADYNGDAVVDVFDLLNFQTDWEARDPKADLDGDGQFLIFDYLVLLTAIDQCG